MRVLMAQDQVRLAGSTNHPFTLNHLSTTLDVVIDTTTIYVVERLGRCTTGACTTTRPAAR
jgi:hypothetical protein